MLASDGSHALFPLVVGIEIGGVTLHDGIAQFRRPAHRSVFGEVIVDGCDGRFFDVLRGGEMGFTGPKIDQVGAGGAQLLRLRDNRHGGGNLDALKSIGEGRGELSSGCRHGLSLYVVGIPIIVPRFSASLRRRCSSTSSGTRPVRGPPKEAISRTMRELRYEYFSAGIMNTVSTPGSILRFMRAICSSNS